MAELEPRDLVTAAEFVRRACDPAVGDDWSVTAGDLKWDIRSTLEHAAGCVVAYALHLGSRANAFSAMHQRAYSDASQTQLLDAVVLAARLFATVCEATPDDVRAYHPAAMADRTGFLAMAIDEIVVHGRDVAAALSIPFDPPQTIAGKVVDRLFPWTPPHDDNWAALLWANGRLTVPGWPVVPADWGWWPAPLHEWDGTGPLEYRGNASYRLDPTSQRWLPNDT